MIPRLLIPRRMIHRLAIVLLGAAVALFALAPPALADAAGPTDYRTDIVSVEPETPAIKVEMIGGDAFLSLEQLLPVEIIVLGYQAEPYLRFDADGTVYENRRSPAVWLNQERYGNEEPPAFADPDARPEWFEVASDGRYAWHDHRSHWMNSQPPPSAQAGDQVLEATVPIQVDGESVVVTVASYLLDSPSPVPTILGALIGLGAAVAVWKSARLPAAIVALLVSGGAALIGAVAYNSVPTETQPSPLLWVLPVVAVTAALLVVLVRNRTATTVYLDGLIVAAGAALVTWGGSRFEALRRALIPSDTPESLDRATIALTLVAGVALALHGLNGLIHPERLGLTEAPQSVQPQ